MKNLIKLIGIIALVAVIGFSFIACNNDININNGDTKDDGKKAPPSFDTTALNAVINEAWGARVGVETASSASEVPTGKKWVTESEWNAFDGVYKTAVETKANPSSQSAVDSAKTNLQAAIVTFNAAKKDGSGSAITLSGTITVKNNGQIVPYVVIQIHDADYSFSEIIKSSLSVENTPWSIITKPFSTSTEILFDIIGYDNDKYENYLFQTSVDGLSKTVYNTDINNININLNLNSITISGTFNLNYNEQTIPSVRIDIFKKSDNFKLGSVDLLNVKNNVSWSTNIPSQTVDTDVVFHIVGFNGPSTYEYDRLFGLWNQDFGVKVKNQNITGVALNLITISGTVSVNNKGNPFPTVVITIWKGDWRWLANTELKSPSANTPWSIVISAYTSDTEIFISVEGKDENDEEVFWERTENRTVKNTNVSGIALNYITISGTINVTYNGSLAPIVEIHIHKKVDDDYITGMTLNSPSANAPWTIWIPAFTNDTEIRFNVAVGDNEDNLQWSDGGVTRTVKNSNVSDIALNLGNITE
ncbi:MAG: hypothetical protein LBC76_09590 [Treponema sp.]|jgi:hypothetical protein|nr:hypothetical protein [Treponema sp.]